MANGRAGSRRGRSRQASFSPIQAVSMSFDTDLVAAIGRFEQKIQGDLLAKVAYAGVNVFYDGLRESVPVDEGDLYGAIYKWFDKKRSTPMRKIYATGPNKRKAPHWHNAEYGHWRVNAVRFVNGRWIATKERLATPKWVNGRPYVRPTFDGRRQRAFDAMRSRLKELLAQAARETNR